MNNEPKMFDPMTGQPISQPQPMGSFDPVTGQPIGQPQSVGGFDPVTGQPIGQPQPMGSFDSLTGQPIGQPQPMGSFDSLTGQPINQTQSAGSFDPITGQPIGQSAAPLRDNTSGKGKLKKKIEKPAKPMNLKFRLIFSGVAAFFVAVACVLCLLFIQIPIEEQLIQSVKNSCRNVAESFSLGDMIDDLSEVRKSGSGQISVDVTGYNAGTVGVYYNSSDKKVLLDAILKGQAYTFYLDDEEISISDSNDVVYLNFEELPDKLKSSPIFQQSGGTISDEDLKKLTETIKELRAMIWDWMKETPMEGEEQEEILQKFKDSITIEKNGEKEFETKDGKVTCDVYDVTIQLDSVSDYLCDMYGQTMDNMSEHLCRIVEITTGEDLLSQVDQMKDQINQQIRRSMEEAKQQIGSTFTFQMYQNGDAFAGFYINQTVDGNTVEMEVSCPTGNFFEQAKVKVNENGRSFEIENVGLVSGDELSGTLSVTNGEQKEVIASYIYNKTSGEYKITSSDGDQVSGKLLYNRNTKTLELGFYEGDEKVTISVGGLTKEIVKPAGTRHNILEENLSQLQGIFSSSLGNQYSPSY